jgi:hypothetical protein
VLKIFGLSPEHRQPQDLCVLQKGFAPRENG